MVENWQHGINRASLRIFSSVNQTPNARMRDGSGTHRTGFDGYVEIAVEQAIVATGLSGFSKCKYLGVCRWIVAGERAITSAANDTTFAHDDRSDGNLSQRESALRFAQSFFHPEFVGVGHVGEG